MKSKLMFLLVAGLWITQGQGLKCYVCDMEQDGCNYNVSVTPSSEVHLKECHPSALGCLVLLTEDNTYLNDEKRWYQRACLYFSDLICFKIDSKKTLQRGARFRANFLEVANCSNSERKALKADYPQMDILSSKHVVATAPRYDDTRYLSANYVKICEGKGDGCNHWDKRIMYPHHEGYDWDAANNHFSGTQCYGCSAGNPTGEGDNKKCWDDQIDGSPKFDWKISEHYIPGAGCATLVVYRAVHNYNKVNVSHITRQTWLLGTHHCLQISYKSTPPPDDGYSRSRSLLSYSRSNGEDSCDNLTQSSRYGKENPQELTSYWISQRLFYSAREYAEFLECRQDILWSVDNLATNEIDTWMDLNQDEIIALAESETGPPSRKDKFAYVHFLFCRTLSYCNFWSGDRIFSTVVFQDGRVPRTKGTTEKTTASTTASTTKPTLTTTTPSGDKKIKEVPDEDCFVEPSPKQNGAMRVTSTMQLRGILLFALLFTVVSKS